MNVIKPKNFISLDAFECSNTYPVLIENAERHFCVSEILNENKEFPNAVSHLILGSEELIKAFFLMLVSKGFILRDVKGYNRIFFNHTARHSFMKEFFSIWLGFKNIMVIEKKRENENPWLYGLNVLIKSLRVTVTATMNYEWWSNADLLKQRCFYVDFDEAIFSPATILETQYLEARNHVSTFRDEFKKIQLDFEEATEMQLMEFFKLIEEAGFKESLEEMIKRSRT